MRGEPGRSLRCNHSAFSETGNDAIRASVVLAPKMPLETTQHTLQLDKLFSSLVTWFFEKPAAISGVFAGFALLLNACQSARSDAQSRAAFVAKWLEQFADDQEMMEIYYKIEYGEFTYSQESFHGSDAEKQLDKLLIHLSNVALAQKAGLLSPKDLCPLQYLALRVLNDSNVQNYLNYVLKVAKSPGLGIHPYAALDKMKKHLASNLCKSFAD